MKPTGGFGERLRALFAEGCPITFKLESSHDVEEYSFTTPPDSCLGAQVWVYRYYPGYKGRIIYDPAASAILRVEIVTTGFPASFEVKRVEERAERIKIERNSADVIRQEFKNHRHFEASTNVTFDE